MVEVVINYDPDKHYFKIYEPTTDTLMASANLGEALIILNQFLQDSGLSKTDILKSPDISYHLDSHTMKEIIEGNLKLLQRLNQAPSGFQNSQQKFGGKPDGGEKKKEKKRGNALASATGFRSAYKKFGGNNF